MNAMTAEGRSIIQRSETLRLMPYLDPKGIRTVGYGHRMYSGEFRPADFPLTEDRANALLDKDIALKSTWVAHYVHVPLNDNQFSALVSLVFNEGVTPLCEMLGTRLNRGDYAGAAAEFDRWVYADIGGEFVRLEGLITRRAAEKQLFLKPIEEILPWLTTTSK